MRVRNFIEDFFEGRQKAWPFFLERKGTFRELSSGAMDVFAGLTISFATHVNIIALESLSPPWRVFFFTKKQLCLQEFQSRSTDSNRRARK